MPSSVALVHLKPPGSAGGLQRIQMSRADEFKHGPKAVKHADGSNFMLSPQGKSPAAPPQSFQLAPSEAPAK
jgi:hypothetical protein